MECVISGATAVVHDIARDDTTVVQIVRDSMIECPDIRRIRETSAASDVHVRSPT
jgi:hypothetical protein